MSIARAFVLPACSILLVLEVKAAMLAGILFVTLAAWATGIAAAPESIVQVRAQFGSSGSPC